MSNDEQDTMIQLGEERYNTHTLGQALELKYANETVNITLLLLNVIDMCGPVFDSDGFNMNVGLYWDSVYIGVSAAFTFWANPSYIVPDGYTKARYGTYLNQRRLSAIRK